jgi:hypothetical protein
MLVRSRFHHNASLGAQHLPPNDPRLGQFQMNDDKPKAQSVAAAHKETARHISIYQGTLVEWVDEEGNLQIDTYARFLQSRS